MNDEPNTNHWNVGDMVIHDADAKEWRMLMEVTGYSSETGLCQTEYIDDSACKPHPNRWENGIEFLHDPSRFDLKNKPWSGGIPPLGQSVVDSLESRIVVQTQRLRKSAFYEWTLERDNPHNKRKKTD